VLTSGRRAAADVEDVVRWHLYGEASSGIVGVQPSEPARLAERAPLPVVRQHRAS
jgi:hypothetical protein